MNLSRKNKANPAEGSVINAHTELVAVLIKQNKHGKPERREVRRVVKDKMVTTAFVNYLVDSLEGTQADWINFKYHDSGIGVGAEAVGDTGLGTPWSGARSTGTQIDGTSANIYKSVATPTYNATKATTFTAGG